MIQANSCFICHNTKYIAPKVKVFFIEPKTSILVASNEGLEYEDLFSTTESIVKDETFPL